MTHAQNCLCGVCVRAATTEKLANSVRAVLRPDPAKLHAAKEALKQVLNLLEELTDEPLCECPECTPELWADGPEKVLLKDGKLTEPYTCKKLL